MDQKQEKIMVEARCIVVRPEKESLCPLEVGIKSLLMNTCEVPLKFVHLPDLRKWLTQGEKGRGEYNVALCCVEYFYDVT